MCVPSPLQAFAALDPRRIGTRALVERLTALLVGKIQEEVRWDMPSP